MQLHLKVIDDSLPKQASRSLFCTSSRTNEVPFIAHELVQHLPTAQCSSFKHERASMFGSDEKRLVTQASKEARQLSFLQWLLFKSETTGFEPKQLQLHPSAAGGQATASFNEVALTGYVKLCGFLVRIKKKPRGFVKLCGFLK